MFVLDQLDNLVDMSGKGDVICWLISHTQQAWCRHLVTSGPKEVCDVIP